MPYDETLLRIERFDTQINYHAAYSFLNLRGVMAERWAHGPVFGGTKVDDEQVLLVPPITPGSDNRLWGAYGLRGAALNGEGVVWVERARELVNDWYSDVLEVLKPKRIVRMSVDVFALYRTDDPVASSRRLREAFYNQDALRSLLPDEFQDQRNDFHAAVDFIALQDEEGSGVSVIAGAVGPPHKGMFFVHPDEDRDNSWWMGIRYNRRRHDADGHRDVVGRMNRMAKVSVADVGQLAARLFGEVFE